MLINKKKKILQQEVNHIQPFKFRQQKPHDAEVRLCGGLKCLKAMNKLINSLPYTQ